MASSINQQYAMLIPLALGLSAGLLIRTMATRELATKLAGVADNLALKVLLPLVVFEAIAANVSGATVLLPIALGFMFPILLTAIFKALKVDPSVAIAGSTFGGGSRGTALLLLIASQEQQFPALIQQFILLDLGNFLCMIFLLPRALSYLGVQDYKDNDNRVPNRRDLMQLLSQNYVLYVIGFTVFLAAVTTAYPAFIATIAESKQVRGLVLSATLFFAIAIKIQARGATVPRRDLIQLSLGRILLALLVVTLFYVSILSEPLLLACLVLIAMPPSSLLPALAAQNKISEQVLTRILPLVMAGNLLFLAYLLIGSIKAWFL
jgi:hypothetical protein